MNTQDYVNTDICMTKFNVLNMRIYSGAFFFPEW